MSRNNNDPNHPPRPPNPRPGTPQNPWRAHPNPNIPVINPGAQGRQGVGEPPPDVPIPNPFPAHIAPLAAVSRASVLHLLQRQPRLDIGVQVEPLDLRLQPPQVQPAQRPPPLTPRPAFRNICGRCRRYPVNGTSEICDPCNLVAHSFVTHLLCASCGGRMFEEGPTPHEQYPMCTCNPRKRKGQTSRVPPPSKLIACPPSYRMELQHSRRQDQLVPLLSRAGGSIQVSQQLSLNQEMQPSTSSGAWQPPPIPQQREMAAEGNPPANHSLPGINGREVPNGGGGNPAERQHNANDPDENEVEILLMKRHLNNHGQVVYTPQGTHPKSSFSGSSQEPEQNADIPYINWHDVELPPEVRRNFIGQNQLDPYWQAYHQHQLNQLRSQGISSQQVCENQHYSDWQNGLRARNGDQNESCRYAGHNAHQYYQRPPNPHGMINNVHAFPPPQQLNQLQQQRQLLQGDRQEFPRGFQIQDVLRQNHEMAGQQGQQHFQCQRHSNIPNGQGQNGQFGIANILQFNGQMMPAPQQPERPLLPALIPVPGLRPLPPLPPLPALNDMHIQPAVPRFLGDNRPNDVGGVVMIPFNAAPCPRLRGRRPNIDEGRIIRPRGRPRAPRGRGRGRGRGMPIQEIEIDGPFDHLRNPRNERPESTGSLSGLVPALQNCGINEPNESQNGERPHPAIPVPPENAGENNASPNNPTNSQQGLNNILRAIVHIEGDPERGIAPAPQLSLPIFPHVSPPSPSAFVEVETTENTEGNSTPQQESHQIPEDEPIPGTSAEMRRNDLSNSNIPGPSGANQAPIFAPQENGHEIQEEPRDEPPPRPKAKRGRKKKDKNDNTDCNR